MFTGGPLECKGDGAPRLWEKAVGTGDYSAGTRDGFTRKEEQPTDIYGDVIRKISSGC